MFELKTRVRVDEGLHTRPSTQFAKLAKSFKCEVEIVRDGQVADGKSAVKVMLLGVKQNEEIILRATGEDEKLALAELQKFLFSEDISVESSCQAAKSPNTTSKSELSILSEDDGIYRAVKGMGASEGHRVGTAFFYVQDEIELPKTVIKKGKEEAEWTRFYQAFCQLRDKLVEQSTDSGSAEDRLIIEALLDVSEEDEFVGEIKRRILSGNEATAACIDVGNGLAACFESMSDQYMQARADDIRGLTRQLALKLLGKEDRSLSDLHDSCIVVANDLSALDFARANLEKIEGIICMRGSATSHIAIMARAHGIPAILGLSLPLSSLTNIQKIAMDGTTGKVWFDPDESVVAKFHHAQAEEFRQQEALRDFRDFVPKRRDGVTIEVAANLGTLKEIGPAKEFGAMGVGLFRTELLFMDRRSLPDEEEQTQIYTELAQAFFPDPVIIRTLDIGGDKPVPGIQFPEEENPFLGWRGVRMCLDRPDIFRPQLRALLKASIVGNVRVMFPMISDVDELRRAKAMLEDCARDLREEGIVIGGLQIGIMVETPAAALTASCLATEVDFFSIGTNDLTQYIMAADRLNPMLQHLYRPDHPAVLAAIKLVCDAAATAGIKVGVCGEAASKPSIIPTLIELGVTELSMSPSSILRAKQVISNL